MNDIASTIYFRDVCAMLDRVKKAQLNRKEIILRRYYDSFCKHRQSFRQQKGLPIDQEEDGNSSYYSILRLLLPAVDNARDAYGLQITALGRLYIRILQLAPDSRDAERLQYRSYSSVRGDYADVVFSVLIPRCQRQLSDLTLKQVHDILDIIATEDTTVKERELIRFSEIASPEEQKWMIRLLLKSMGLGIGMQRIFKILHPMAEPIYQHCASLKRVCKLLADNKMNADLNVTANGNQLKPNVVVEPFQQIRPMLCERFPGKIEELMASDVVFMETKMDGERFQIHFANGRFKYISRNGTDYTFSFGSNFTEGTLTPKLQSLMPIGLQSIIIDGEMMVWDTQQKRFRDKGENTDVKHLNQDRGWQPCFIAYDLLYLNGKSQLEVPYVSRTYKLQHLLKEKPGVLEVIKSEKISSIDDFNVKFQAVLDSNAEGIVLKKQNSIYKPGVRMGGGWYKDKADYIKGLTTEFDLLIIGGFYNRKHTYIKSFLLGVIKLGNGQQHDEVYSVGRVDNNKCQNTLNHTLRPYWQDMTVEPPPIWYHYKDGNAEGRPDVWIEPKNSTILQIKAADLTAYAAFYTSKSLHFPRVEAWRNDKIWNECMTLQEYTHLCQNKVGIKKINKRQLCLGDLTEDRKRQKMTPAEKRKLELESYEKRFDGSKLSTSSALFDGFSFCILSGSPRRRYTKQDLQNLAARNGGTIVENPLPNDPKCICVAGDITFYVERLKRTKPLVNDIVRMDWLLRVCELQQIYLRPKDMIAMTNELEAQFLKSFDSFNDSYIDSITSIQEMQEILGDIDDSKVNVSYVEPTAMTHLEATLLKEYGMPNFYRGSWAYFYNCSTPSSLLNKLYFQQRAGRCIDDINNAEEVKHLRFIFICLGQFFDERIFKSWLREHFKLSQLQEIQVINEDWIKNSHHAKQRLPVDDFIWSSS